MFSSAYPPWVNNIQAAGVLNKNRLKKCITIAKKQLKKGTRPLWTAYIKKKKQCGLVQLKWNLIIFEIKYIQKQQRH